MKTVTCMVFSLLAVQGLAQKKQPFVFADLERVQLDAVHTEWDTLYAADGEGLWHYNVGQDAENLYIAVRVDDPMLQNLAARNGILVGFPATGGGKKKKKKDVLMLYPFPDRETKRAIQNEDFDPEKDYRAELIERSRGYLVDGFPTVIDGLLSLQNQYGIAAIARAAKDSLLYEAAVPKRLLAAGDGKLTVRIAVNSLLALAPASGSSRNRNAYGAYGRRGAYAGRPPVANRKAKTVTEVLLEGTLK